MIQMRFLLVMLLFITIDAHSILAQKVKEPTDTNPEWSKAYPPFRIVGNLYYVGTYDLACYLIVTPEGNLLINTGLASSGRVIKENIEDLGFKLTDTKVLLTTQAHYDHVGAMAEIKELTKARFMANTQDVVALEDGGLSDYELGQYGVTFKPVYVDDKLQNGDTIKLGGMKLTMLHHPGHTKGSSSYLFDVSDGHKTYKVLIVNMPSIISDRKFSDISSYPTISNDYAYTLDALKKLSFDLWLSSHASQFRLHETHKPGDVYNPESFADRSGYDERVSDLERQYLEKMKE